MYASAAPCSYVVYTNLPIPSFFLYQTPQALQFVDSWAFLPTLVAFLHVLPACPTHLCLHHYPLQWFLLFVPRVVHAPFRFPYLSFPPCAPTLGTREVASSRPFPFPSIPPRARTTASELPHWSATKLNEHWQSEIRNEHGARGQKLETSNRSKEVRNGKGNDP